MRILGGIVGIVVVAIKDSFAEEAVNCLVAGRESEQYLSTHHLLSFKKK
jgi:hypothetical protein